MVVAEPQQVAVELLARSRLGRAGRGLFRIGLWQLLLQDLGEGLGDHGQREDHLALGVEQIDGLEAPEDLFGVVVVLHAHREVHLAVFGLVGYNADEGGSGCAGNAVAHEVQEIFDGDFLGHVDVFEVEVGEVFGLGSALVVGVGPEGAVFVAFGPVDGEGGAAGAGPGSWPIVLNKKDTESIVYIFI